LIFIGKSSCFFILNSGKTGCPFMGFSDPEDISGPEDLPIRIGVLLLTRFTLAIFAEILLK